VVRRALRETRFVNEKRAAVKATFHRTDMTTGTRQAADVTLMKQLA
jgi:hypothetical protein